MLTIKEALKELKEDLEDWEIYDEQVFFPALEEASKKLGFKLEGESNGEFSEITTIFDTDYAFEPLNIENCEEKYKTKEELVKAIIDYYNLDEALNEATSSQAYDRWERIQLELDKRGIKYDLDLGPHQVFEDRCEELITINHTCAFGLFKDGSYYSICIGDDLVEAPKGMRVEKIVDKVLRDLPESLTEDENKKSFIYKGIKVIHSSETDNVEYLKTILDNLILNHPKFFKDVKTYEFRFEQAPRGGTLPDLIDGKPAYYTSDGKQLKIGDTFINEDLNSEKTFALIECNWNDVQNLSDKEKLEIMGYDSLEEFIEDDFEEDEIEDRFNWYIQDYDTKDSLQQFGCEILGSFDDEGVLTQYFKVKLNKSNVKTIRDLWFVSDFIEINLEDLFKETRIDDLLHNF